MPDLLVTMFLLVAADEDTVVGVDIDVAATSVGLNVVMRFLDRVRSFTHLDETSHMSAEFVFRYGPKCMGGLILPILDLLHL